MCKLFILYLLLLILLLLLLEFFNLIVLSDKLFLSQPVILISTFCASNSQLYPQNKKVGVGVEGEEGRRCAK